MGDITITQRDYERLKSREARAGGYTKLARERAEHAGTTAWKEGHKGLAAKLWGGANAPALQAIAGGAAVYYAATYWLSNFETFKKHWWLRPLLVIGLGYVLWRRQSRWAMALLSAGAAMFVQAWKEEQEKKKLTSSRSESGPPS